MGVATVEVRGHAFRVTSSIHPRSARSVLLVHGIGISHRAFARLHRELEPFASVYSVDLPGFGSLPAPRRSPGVPEMASLLGRAVERALAAAGASGRGTGAAGREAAGAAGTLIAVGGSMGAQWVVELARQRPDLVSRLVAIGPVVNDARRTAAAQGLALLADTLREPPSANAIVFGDYLRCGPRWYLRQLRPMLRYRIEDRVAGLPQPLLIVRGGRDPIAPAAWCERLAGRAPVARIADIPGQPHLAQHTAPAAVAREIARFAGIPGPAAAEPPA
ncbi:alpha/beta fold hydrolase [Leucobacter massiliensis]|uniref:AB hydrolase-1 domain-containing protein n=1 Tax=Leucobacter massiliensis TaxID=1686285 RepID=A0A2S9QLK7_9MICO|nr:alpha/beta hydrolase [Leucobacter massiliensis]PRI10479.1 hypothetical protein B4915_11930 [Leucobacter massiliensis]